MKLFNKDNRGAEELNALTGIYYASNNYDNIASEISYATNEVAALVGYAVIEKAACGYEENQDSELVRLVKMPIACLAVARYFKQVGVSHEDSGRKVKIDANEKVPFEWMLDRDERAMHEKYCRSLDALFSYLEQKQIEEWLSSSTRKLLAESIVRSLYDFERIYPIEHSYYTYFMLLPLIIEVQNSKLHKALGNTWARIAGETIDECDRTTLHYAQRAAVLYAVITAVERWSIEVFPQAIARRFMPTYQGNKASKVATTEEIDWYLDRLRKQATEAMEELIAAVSGDINPYENFPVLPKNDKRKKYFNAGV